MGHRPRICYHLLFAYELYNHCSKFSVIYLIGNLLYAEQPYQSGYTAPPPRAEDTTIDIRHAL